MLNTHTKKSWFKSILLILIFGCILGLISKQLFRIPTAHTHGTIKTNIIKTADAGDNTNGIHPRIRAE